MRIPRIYHNAPLHINSEVELEEAAVRHVVQVLRLKPDSPVILFNGDLHEYHARLLQADRKHARVVIEAVEAVDRESPLATHLALGISKGERMDYAIQKAVELGVNTITPLLTERCVVQLDDRREAKRLQHWQGIIRSAGEQCGRTRLPVLHPVISLAEFLQNLPDCACFLLDPRSELTVSQCPPEQGLVLLIGPEGGFSEQERAAAYQAGVKGLQLGPRILRTETAVVAGLAVVQAVWGDLDSKNPDR